MDLLGINSDEFIVVRLVWWSSNDGSSTLRAFAFKNPPARDELDRRQQAGELVDLYPFTARWSVSPLPVALSEAVNALALISPLFGQCEIVLDRDLLQRYPFRSFRVVEDARSFCTQPRIS